MIKCSLSHWEQFHSPPEKVYERLLEPGTLGTGDINKEYQVKFDLPFRFWILENDG